MKKILLFLFIFQSISIFSQKIEILSDSTFEFRSTIGSKNIDVSEIRSEKRIWKFDLDNKSLIINEIQKNTSVNYIYKLNILKINGYYFHVSVVNFDNVNFSLVTNKGKLELIEFVEINGLVFGKIFKSRIKIIYY